MNQIVSFRLCKLSNLELLKKVDELTDKIYIDGKIPTRHIPARPDEDYDLLVGELLKRFQELDTTLTTTLPPQPVKDDWVSVEDGLPEVDKHVLVIEKDIFNDTDISIARYSYDGGWYRPWKDITAAVTHWHKLPAHPNEQNITPASAKNAQVENISQQGEQC